MKKAPAPRAAQRGGPPGSRGFFCFDGYCLGCAGFVRGRAGGVDEPTPLSLQVNWPLTFWMSPAHWLAGPIADVCQVPSGFRQKAINVCPCILTSLQLVR